MKNKAGVLLVLCVIIFFCLMSGCSNPSQGTSESTFWDFENVPYGTSRDQTFNIILPKEKNDVHAIVYIHGGFYYAGDKLWYPLFLTEFSKKNIFVTIDYRLIDLTGRNNIQMNDMLIDVDNALKKVQELAGKNGYSIKDFILAGHSAGAHIGLLYGYKYFQKNNTQTKIAACVSLAGPTDYTDDIGWSSMQYYGEKVEERLAVLSLIGTALTGHEIKLTENWTKQSNWSEYKDYAEAISPITYIEAGNVPPTLLVHGPDDSIVPYSNSTRLYDALGTALPHKLIPVTETSGNNHMLGGEPYSATGKPIEYKNQAWVEAAKEWLEPYLQ